MGLIDIINSVPLNVASKIVEKTGNSKYNFAQICNITASVLAGYGAVRAGMNSDFIPMAIASVYSLSNLKFAIFNPIMKSTEDPNYTKIAVEESYKKYPDLSKESIRTSIEQKLETEKATEKKFLKLAPVQIILGVGFAAMASVGAFVSSGEENMITNYSLYAICLSPSFIFDGIAHYFRASK